MYINLLGTANCIVDVLDLKSEYIWMVIDLKEMLINTV